MSLFTLIRTCQLTEISKHAFDVIRSAGSSTYNYKNPVRRDVVSIGGATDNVTIRFRTDNPGPWILHWWETFFGGILLLITLLVISTGTWICK